MESGIGTRNANVKIEWNAVFKLFPAKQWKTIEKIEIDRKNSYFVLRNQENKAKSFPK